MSNFVLLTKYFVLPVGIVLTLATPASFAQGTDDAPAVIVNGVAIKRSAVVSATRSIAPGQQRPESTVIEEIVNLEVLAQEALAKKLEKTPEVIAEIDNQRRALLAKAAVTSYLAANPIKDDAVQKFYQAQTQGGPRQEYRIRHILSKTEAESKAVIADLDKGTDFATLAKERSTDSSAAQGGELGWIEPSRLPKQFGDGLKLVPKGSYSKTPVQTTFGWHVIRVEDQRDLKLAPFEQVKDQLRLALQNKMVTDYIGELKKKAKIEVK